MNEWVMNEVSFCVTQVCCLRVEPPEGGDQIHAFREFKNLEEFLVAYKESWAPKSWCFWTVVLEKTLETPLDSKEIQPIHPKGN